MIHTVRFAFIHLHILHLYTRTHIYLCTRTLPHVCPTHVTVVPLCLPCPHWITPHYYPHLRSLPHACYHPSHTPRTHFAHIHTFPFVGLHLVYWLFGLHWLFSSVLGCCWTFIRLFVCYVGSPTHTHCRHSRPPPIYLPHVWFPHRPHAWDPLVVITPVPCCTGDLVRIGGGGLTHAVGRNRSI